VDGLVQTGNKAATPVTLTDFGSRCRFSWCPVEGVLNHAATLLFNFDFRLGSILRKYQSLTKKKLNMIEEEKGSYVRSVRTPSSDRSSVTATRLAMCPLYLTNSNNHMTYIIKRRDMNGNKSMIYTYLLA
jgi:hypothetical protein